MKGQTGLEIKDLVWYPASSAKPILDGVNLSFCGGRFYGILGPNGSGKTSLLRHILQFLKPVNGKIYLDGKRIEEYSRIELARKLAFVPQNTSLTTSFSAYEIVFMGRTPYQKHFQRKTKEDISKVEEAMGLSSCLKLRNRQVRNLSGGEAQRVIIARAIAQETPWLLLDEPVSNLDIRHQLEVMETLKKLNEERGTSIITVLHDINLAASYCSDIVMMKEGKVNDTGTVLDVLTCQRLSDVYGVSFFKTIHPKTGKPYFIAEPKS